jgi:hypothetical protein
MKLVQESMESQNEAWAQFHGRLAHHQAAVHGAERAAQVLHLVSLCTGHREYWVSKALKMPPSLFSDDECSMQAWRTLTIVAC